MIVSNSSPLILLAKINKLNLLEKLYKRISIPHEVYVEAVVKGKRENYSDAGLIEKCIDEFIFVETLASKYQDEARKFSKFLGTGESESLALCLQVKAKLLLIDNLEPRKIAQSMGIRCRGTPGILLEALKMKIISYNDYELAIKELAKSAWLSGDIVAEFFKIGYKMGGKSK